jgi:hypothetical protein
MAGCHFVLEVFFSGRLRAHTLAVLPVYLPRLASYWLLLLSKQALCRGFFKLICSMPSRFLLYRTRSLRLGRHSKLLPPYAFVPVAGLQGSMGYEFQAVTHTSSDEKKQIKIVFNQGRATDSGGLVCTARGCSAILSSQHKGRVMLGLNCMCKYSATWWGLSNLELFHIFWIPSQIQEAS